MSNEARPSAARIGALGFLAIALVCAAFAFYLVNRLMHAKGYSGERVKQIVVAKKALPAAQPIPKDALEIINWPESSVPAGAFNDIAAIFQGGHAPVPTTGILAGEPVTSTRLAAASQGTGLAAVVQPGMRAVAVKMRDTVGRSGLVYPGAHVDILATIRDPEGRGPSTRIAVQNVRVLSVELETDVATSRPPKEGGGNLSSSGSSSVDGTVVTLEVTPEAAEIVSLADREGNVDFALRNGSDNEIASTAGATPFLFSAYPQSLLVEDETVAAPAPAPTKGSGQRIRLEAKDRGQDTNARDIEMKASRGGTQEIETYHAPR